jgi:hypothetical protein
VPNTVGAVLVLLLAILPGRIGAFFLESLSGRDWRERDWLAVLRLLGISAVGLATYAIAAGVFGWPAARHTIPAQIESVTAETLADLAVPYFGHIAASALAGIGLALFLRVYSRAAGITYRASAWDTFAAQFVPGRWVVVTLKSGDVYAGFVRVADTGVAAAERDIVLGGPSLYDAATQKYEAVGYHDLFLQAPLIDSIATVSGDDEAEITFQEPGTVLPAEMSDAGKGAAATPDAERKT